MFHKIESCNKNSSFFSGAKLVSAILNSQCIIDAVKNLNDRKNAKSITCFDFSALYKGLPYGKLLRILKEHIDF